MYTVFWYLAKPRFRRLVAGLSVRRARLVHVGFVVNKVALGQIFLRVIWFSNVNIIPAPYYHLGDEQ
jgi:hypothetical protein